MGKARYGWVTLLPLTWLVIVNMTAGWEKIFSPDTRLGFLAHARLVDAALAVGHLPQGATSTAAALRMAFNDRLDAAVAAFFLVSVVIILIESVREWARTLAGRTSRASTEIPFRTRTPTAVGAD
jgi:carbon starvation protein